MSTKITHLSTNYFHVRSNSTFLNKIILMSQKLKKSFSVLNQKDKKGKTVFGFQMTDDSIYRPKIYTNVQELKFLFSELQGCVAFNDAIIVLYDKGQSKNNFKHCATVVTSDEVSKEIYGDNCVNDAIDTVKKMLHKRKYSPCFYLDDKVRS